MTPHCFNCTSCGVCCHNTMIPLTFDEAVSWAQDGGLVGMSAQVLQWSPSSEEHLASIMGTEALEWWRERTTPSRCGRVDVRVSLRLFAIISGACHNLRAGKLCAIYDRRPSVCRAYPIEVNEPPSLPSVFPEATQCPSEAWTGPRITEADGRPTASPERDAYMAYQKAWCDDQLVLRHLRDLHGIKVGALPYDCEAIHPMEPADLLRKAHQARERLKRGAEPASSWWQITGIDKDLLRNLKSSGAFIASRLPKDLILLAGQRWR